MGAECCVVRCLIFTVAYMPDIKLLLPRRPFQKMPILNRHVASCATQLGKTTREGARASSLFQSEWVSVSRPAVSDAVTPWTVARQAPLSMRLSRQEYWRVCHCLLQGIFLIQGWDPGLLRCRQSPSQLSHQVFPESPG